MLHRRILVLYMVVLLPLSSLGCWTSFPVMPSAETARAIPQQAPQWNVNDYWNYSYTQRPEKFNLTVFDPESGDYDSAACCGTSEHYELFTVVDVSDPIWYKVNYTSWTCRTGEYVLYLKGAPVSGTGAYIINSKITSDIPKKIRKSDLNAGDGKDNVIETTNWNWTSSPSRLPPNTTTNDTIIITYPSGPIKNYRFPLELSTTWPIWGEMKERHTGRREIQNNGALNWDYTDSYNYTGATGRTTDKYETQDAPPKGPFEDCYHISLSGTIDLRHSGTYWSSDGQRYPIEINETGNFSQERWYSNKAGNIVNYNSTTATTGIVLKDYVYKQISPNAPPALETVDGIPPGHSTLVEVSVREGEPKSIELAIADLNADKLNWSVVMVDGTGNVRGARLMDGNNTPYFDNPNQTGPVKDNIFRNNLNITARQPMTVSGDVYTITVNVDDGRYGGSVNFSFRVRVHNVNNRPNVVMPVPDVFMKENSTMSCTSWSINDIFVDQDMEAGIPDPPRYSAEVISGPPLSLSIDAETGYVTFFVPDYAHIQPAPILGNSTVRYTCTDSGSGDRASRSSNTTTGVVHIEHVNHDPALSPNGTSIAENGLTWYEDTVDTRLDLDKAFFDADKRYAGDNLTFNFSGNLNIDVNVTGGHVTLAPERDWNGKETIKFWANDVEGRPAILRVDCNVVAVPDAPRFCETEMDITWDNTGALTIKEADGPNGSLNKKLLTVFVMDPDAWDTHLCQWWINDSMGKIVSPGRSFEDDDDIEFKCDWVGNFSSQFSPYEIKCVAKDSFGLTSTYVWNLTVLNVNRPPVPRIVGSPDNSTFIHGSSVSFDAWSSYDPDDENRSNLTFIWTSNKQGLLNQDCGQAGAQFSYNNLKPGRHLITLTVLDSEGDESTVSFRLDIIEESEQQILSLPVIIAMLIIATAAGIAVAGLLSRKKR